MASGLPFRDNQRRLRLDVRQTGVLPILKVVYRAHMARHPAIWKLIGLTAFAVLGAMALASCAQALSISPASVSIDCDSSIDMIEQPPDSYEEFGNFVALPTLPPEPMQVSERDNGLFFSKFGLLVRSGTGGTLEVDRTSAGVFLDYGPADVPGTPGVGELLSVDGCDGELAWVVFAGGIWAEQPGCVLLNVTGEDGASTEVARLPIGSTCP